MLTVSGLYYGVTISLVTFATGLSVVTLSLHHRLLPMVNLMMSIVVNLVNMMMITMIKMISLHHRGMRGTRLSPWLRSFALRLLSLSLTLTLTFFIKLAWWIVRYLVLHLLARLLHIRLEGNGQDEEDEGRKMGMRKKQKKKRVEENDARVEDAGGVNAETWKRGWEEEEKENWPALNGLELGIRLARLENSFIRLVSPD